MGFRSGRPLHHNALPEKEVPHLINPVLVQFPLKRSAYSMFDAHENEFKLLVSYDEVCQLAAVWISEERREEYRLWW